MGSDLETGLTGLSGDPVIAQLLSSANLVEGDEKAKLKKKDSEMVNIFFLKISPLVERK